MSTSLRVAVIVGFGNVYFLIVIFNIHGQRMRFSESSQCSISEKLIFGHFEDFFSSITFSQVGGCFSLLVHSRTNILTKKLAL